MLQSSEGHLQFVEIPPFTFSPRVIVFLILFIYFAHCLLGCQLKEWSWEL